MRPAETTSAIGAVAILIAALFGVDDSTTLAALAAGLGLLPGAVTLLVTNGGLRGCVVRLWRGAITQGKDTPE